jgi:hypothetical protein
LVLPAAAASRIKTKLGNHSFRATGITTYPKNGRTKAAAMTNHASTRTTQLYDRRRDEVSLDEVERTRYDSALSSAFPDQPQHSHDEALRLLFSLAFGRTAALRQIRCCDFFLLLGRFRAPQNAAGVRGRFFAGCHRISPNEDPTNRGRLAFGAKYVLPS